MFTTGDLPAAFRPPETPRWRARMAADRLGLQLVRHTPHCIRDDSCCCLLDAVVAVLDAAAPPV